MSMIRGRIYLPKIPNLRGTFGGDWPYRECACGKWLDDKGEHVKTMSLMEFIKKVAGEKPKCPDEK